MKILISLTFLTIFLRGFGQFSDFPITLSIPFDEDTITTLEPTFVWQCNLSAIQSDPRLSLQFALAELENDQTAAEAISTNLPICLMNGLLSTSYSYPSTLQALEKGKTYVWQVQLLFNDLVVQESEPWKFTIADPQLPIRQFISLNKDQDGSFHIFTERQAWILLKEEYDFTAQNARIRKPGNEIVEVTLDKVFAGDNQDDDGLFNESNFYYLHCNLEPVVGEAGIYTLEVMSKNGHRYSLNFMLE